MVSASTSKRQGSI